MSEPLEWSRPEKHYRAIIFDLDGVIIDSEPLHERAKETLFRRVGISVPRSAYPKFKGIPDRAVVEYVLKEYGDLSHDVDALFALKQEIFTALLPELQPVPGAIELVRATHDSYKLAVTTSALPANVEVPLKRFGIYDAFEVIITANDIERPKPDPQPFLITLKKIGCPARECLVIEDSLNGVYSGIKAGCDVAAITTSFKREDLIRAGAYPVVDSFKELARYLGIVLSYGTET